MLLYGIYLVYIQFWYKYLVYVVHTVLVERRIELFVPNWLNYGAFAAHLANTCFR